MRKSVYVLDDNIKLTKEDLDMLSEKEGCDINEEIIICELNDKEFSAKDDRILYLGIAESIDNMLDVSYNSFWLAKNAPLVHTYVKIDGEITRLPNI